MDDPSSTIHDVNAGDLATDHSPSPARQLLVAPATADTRTEHNTIKFSLVALACWKASDILFEFESSFVLPEIIRQIRRLRALIFRHTLRDPLGKEKVKPSLTVF